ncbi:MAG: hypothetical protein ACYS8K_05475 [Planctomycetota bacterium]|jgi:hypothetical protein
MIGEAQGGSALQLLEELAVRIKARREEAERAGDEEESVGLRAMEAVVDTRLIPLACPDAVVIAGEAARAARQGQSEPEWYAGASALRGEHPEDRTELNKAVRLLRSAQIWPWEIGLAER